MKKFILLCIFAAAVYWGMEEGTPPAPSPSPKEGHNSASMGYKKEIENSLDRLRPLVEDSLRDAREAAGPDSPASSFRLLEKANTLLHFKEALESRIHRDAFVPAEDIPPLLRKALIATEDRRFYEHGAVDLIAITRALFANYTAGRTVEGGSTLAQQTVKNIFLSHDRTLARKMEELVLAIELEREYTKDQILDIYLNTIYFGHGAYGVKEAAHTYFKKEVPRLTTAECAMLAGLPQAPTAYDPLAHPDEAKRRMETVLSLMVQEKYITQEEARKAFTSFSLP